MQFKAKMVLLRSNALQICVCALTMATQILAQSVSDCGCPNTCTADVLTTPAGIAPHIYPFEDRMNYLLNVNMVQTEEEACRQVAGAEFPTNECGGCYAYLGGCIHDVLATNKLEMAEAGSF